MFNKRGVVSIATFSLIILILLIVLGFSYDYYDDSKLETHKILKEQELIYSLGSFRAELLSIVAYENSNLTYMSNLDSQEISIMLTNNSITGEQICKGQLVTTNISSLGIDFCNDYTFYPSGSTNFLFNGSCVSIVT